MLLHPVKCKVLINYNIYLRVEGKPLGWNCIDQYWMSPTTSCEHFPKKCHLWPSRLPPLPIIAKYKSAGGQHEAQNIINMEILRQEEMKLPFLRACAIWWWERKWKERGGGGMKACTPPHPYFILQTGGGGGKRGGSWNSEGLKSCKLQHFPSFRTASVN